RECASGRHLDRPRTPQTDMLKRTLAHCTAALLTLAGVADAGQPPSPQLTEGQAEFSIFMGGQASGREQVRVERQGDTWVVTGSGSVGRPGAATTTRLEIKYTPDLHPTESRLEITQGKRVITIATTYGGTTATSEIT